MAEFNPNAGSLGWTTNYNDSLAELKARQTQPIYDGEGNLIRIGEPESQAAVTQGIIAAMEQYGVQNFQDLPAEVRQSLPGGTQRPQGNLAANFVTNPGVLLAAGGIGSMYLQGPGAGTGAYGAEGTSGLEASYGGATGFDATGNAVYGGGGFVPPPNPYTEPGMPNTPTTTPSGIPPSSDGSDPFGNDPASGPPTGGYGNDIGRLPTATTATTGTAISRILAGNGTDKDYLEVLGQAAPAALSAYGSYAQSKELGDLAKRYEGYGAPYRSQLETISNDPSQFYNSPGAQQAMKSYNQSITPGTGNPAGSPYAQTLGIESLYKQYGAERDRLAGFGGLTQYNQAAPGAAAGAIGAKGSIYGDIGYGIGNVMNPQQNQNTLLDLFRAYNRSGGGY